MRKPRRSPIYRVQVSRPERKDSMVKYLTKSPEDIRAQYGDKIMSIEMYVFSEALSRK